MFDWKKVTTQSLHWEGGNSGHLCYSKDNLQTHTFLPMAQVLATMGFSCKTLMHAQFSALITPRQSILKEGHSTAEWNAQ